MSSIKEILTGVPLGSLGQTKSGLVSRTWPGENFYITHPPTYDIVEHVSEYTFLLSKNKQKTNKQTNKQTKQKTNKQTRIQKKKRN